MDGNEKDLVISNLAQAIIELLAGFPKAAVTGY